MFEPVSYTHLDVYKRQDLWAELFFHNRDYLLASMERFEKQFDLLKQAIASGDEKSLKEMFWQSSKRREKLEK